MSKEVVQKVQPPSLIMRFAGRYGVEPEKLKNTLKATAFKTKEREVTDEQLMALLIVAEKHDLSPWTKEIFAYPDRSGGIVAVVSIDGWIKIVQSHPQFDGVEFVSAPVSTRDEVPQWIECVMYRKDRAHATRIREFYVECKRDTAPWNITPRRMLRHRAFMQCGRICFGFTGLHDDDEARHIVEINAGGNGTAAETAADINAGIAKPGSPAREPAAAIDAEVITPESAGVSYAEVAAQIKDAVSIDALNLARDLIRSIKNEQQRAELDVEERAKRAQLAGQQK
jgi:phage recombination protein Bet